MKYAAWLILALLCLHTSNAALLLLLFAILIGLAWVFSGFNSSDAVTVEKFRAIDQSLNDLKSELRTMRERATCPDLGQYSRGKGK